MEGFQNAKETTAVDLGHLLDDGDNAVVSLVAGDTRLVAHRAVLVDRSPVFSAMFGHDTLEASSDQVTIADVEGPVLRQLLSFLYTMRAPQLPDMASQLLAAADKYGVSGLKAACEQQVAAQLSVETAAAAAVLAVRHSCDSLRKAAVTFIKANFVRVVGTQGWADAVRLQPEDVVEISRLVADPPADTSAPAPADSGTSHQPSTQPRRRRRRHRRTTASAVLATPASRHTPPPDEDTVSHLRSLPAEEKRLRLFMAAVTGAVGELEALLAAGADLAAENGCGVTALHYAAILGNVEVARWLVAQGVMVDARDWMHQTPLFTAVRAGHVAVVRLLLDASADPSARDSSVGMTPLHFAAKHGNAQMAAVLLEAGADRGARNSRGQTPLDCAIEENEQQVVQLLTRT